MLQTAFRATFMNRVSFFKWHKRFKEGREFVMDDERYGRSKKVLMFNPTNDDEYFNE